MTNARKELIVGIVFFAIMVMIGVFTIIVKGYIPFIAAPQDLIVYFKRGVGGLRTGNIVRISGLEVGEVEDMALMPVGVLAHIRVKRGVTIHPGYLIKVRAFSVLGGKYVDIERGMQAMKPLDLAPMSGAQFQHVKRDDEAKKRYDGTTAYYKDGPYQDLPLEGGVEADLLPELGDLAESIKPDVEKAVRNIREVTDKLNSTQGTIGRLIGDAELHETIAKAAKNIEQATEDLKAILHKVNEGEGTLAKLVNDGKLYDNANATAENLASITKKVDEGQGLVGRMFSDKSKLGENVETISERLASILKKADDGTGTIGQLVNNDKLYKELEATVASLRKSVAGLESAKSPLGVLLNDPKAGKELKDLIARLDRTSANIEKVTKQIADGKGTVGRLIMDDKLVRDAEKTIAELRESVEDVREQAPISSFLQAVFTAY